MNNKGKIKDIAGQKFGRLTAISFHGVDALRHAEWLCRCDCGREVVKKSAAMLSGNVTSCGCARIGMGLIDITGQKFNRLTVIGRAGSTAWQQAIWECRCDCGNVCKLPGNEIRAGRTKSCGCLLIDVMTTHGFTGTPEHRAWNAIKQRCYNESGPRYKDWGGRGITMDPQWVDSFEQFLKYVGPRPSAKHSIERINNSGNYEPGNVKWEITHAQVRNRRSNRFLTLNGKTQVITDWCRELGLVSSAIYWRLDNGWSVEDALTNRSSRKPATPQT